MRKPLKAEVESLVFAAVILSASGGLLAHAFVTGEVFYDVGFVPLDILCTGTLWGCIATGLIHAPQMIAEILYHLVFPRQPRAGSSGNGRDDPPPPNTPPPASRDLVGLFQLNKIKQMQRSNG